MIKTLFGFPARTAIAGCVLLVIGCLAAAPLAAASEITLTGDYVPADKYRYREVPFEVPAGTTWVKITMSSDADAQGVSLDIGVRDPDRVRGWTGMKKSEIFLEEADATPNYLPGPIPAGGWHLIVSAPGIKQAPVHYVAHVRFGTARDPFPGFVEAPIRSGPGWYRGDLHMHSAHSDGTCHSAHGKEVPCPVYETLLGARAAGLDFLSLTDHNAMTQNESLRELAPYFDDLLIIPGREMTLIRGHANVFGPTAFLDFQVGQDGGPGFDTLADAVKRASGLISINHPGADCCLWAMKDVDYSRVDALEVVNGGNLDDTGSPEGESSFPLWERLLNQGYRIAGIGGSDNHDGTQRQQVDGEGIGRPTTVVYAEELSQPAILDALRRGHAFLDVWGVRNRFLETNASSGQQHAMMGDTLFLERGARVRLDVHVREVPAGSHISFAGTALPRTDRKATLLDRGDIRRAFDLVGDGGSGWVRVDVRDENGELILIGNPIYLRPAGAPRDPQAPVQRAG